MRARTHRRPLVAAMLALAMTAAACGGDDSDDGASNDDASSAEAESDADEPAEEPADEPAEPAEEPAEPADEPAEPAEAPAEGGDDMAAPAEVPGFDGATIKVGVISDLSGPVAVLGTPITTGGQIYYDYVNSQGGIAGMYPIETVEGDSQYNPTTGVQVYNDMKDDVVLVGQLLGTPITNAVLESLKADGVVASPASLDAYWVREPNLLPFGAPYQIQAINGLDYWVNEGGGSADQVYCTLIQDDPYGEAGMEGVEFAAEHLGLTVTEVARYVSGDTDFSSQIQQLQGGECEVIFLIAAPSVTGPALGAAAQAGFAPQWIGLSPTWINALLGAEALVPYFEAQLLVVGEGTTWGDESVPGMADLVARQQEFAPDLEPNAYVTFGYNQAVAVVALLEQAVANGDLSREGVLAAMEQMGTVSFEGLSGDYQYGPADTRQPALATTIYRIDPSTIDGLAAVANQYEADFAGSYVFE